MTYLIISDGLNIQCRKHCNDPSQPESVALNDCTVCPYHHGVWDTRSRGWVVDCWFNSCPKCGGSLQSKQNMPGKIVCRDCGARFNDTSM